MDAQEWNESLDRIISTLAEMIDLLKNESRRWATSPIFSTPQPSPAAASQPPTSATEPPSPASAIITPPALPPKVPPPSVFSLMPPLISASTLPKTNPYTVFSASKPKQATLPVPFVQETNQPPAPKPTQALEPKLTVIKKKRTNVKVAIEEPKLCSLFYHLTKLLFLNHIKWVAVKGEWRPPLRFVPTDPNVVGRLEWRPPWSTLKSCPDCILEDKDFIRVGE
ncbi:hypothetical protein Hanom_Chr06g00506191 [Helianthus anomalus]